MTYELGPSSATAAELYPEYDYKKRTNKIETKHRSLSGKQYTYKWSTFDEFEFSVDWVTASDMSVINSWWESDTDLLFFITSDSTTEVHSVRIQGEETPLTEYNKPYDNFYKGKIRLSTY